MAKNKKTTNKKARKTQPQRATTLASVKPYVRRILGHVDPNTGSWKKRWNADTVANKYGLTKMQVAAVLANYTIGRYNN